MLGEREYLKCRLKGRVQETVGLCSPGLWIVSQLLPRVNFEQVSVSVRAISCYMRTMQLHRAPAPLVGPLKLQVRSQYLRSDPTEKV